MWLPRATPIGVTSFALPTFDGTTQEYDLPYVSIEGADYGAAPNAAENISAAPSTANRNLPTAMLKRLHP